MSDASPQTPEQPELKLRPVQMGDLEAVENLFAEAFSEEYGSRAVDIRHQVRRLRRWFGPLKVLSTFPNRFQHLFTVHVAEQAGEVKGVIQVSPFNASHTTWRVDHIAVSGTAQRQGIGSRLLRHCMEHFREARTWILEVNIHNKGAMALYRHNGFQPLAQITYWTLSPEVLDTLSHHTPQIPHLIPYSNGDARLICELDTGIMPAQVRQVYGRHVEDFRNSLFDQAMEVTKQSISQTERIQAYVYEPERKAAIGYFNLKVCKNGCQPHAAQLMVHPAYTWLYPELMARMAQLTREYPPQSLVLASTDYQPEREAFLVKMGANDVEKTLLMSRSVWHKLRESRFSLENLPLMLRSLQGTHPLPERIDHLQQPLQADQSSDGMPSGS